MATQKATRATIKLGNIELDVFQLPDGEYFMSLSQIAQTIEIDKKRLSQLRELNMAQTLYPQGFQESETVL